jgi:DnaJ-domain-containing protein 1
MIGQSYKDRGFWETVLLSSAALEPNQTEQAWTLAEEIQRVMGEDTQPDSLFFEESWRYGAPTAVENLRRRRRQQTEGVVFGEFDNLGAQAYVQQRELYADLFPSAKDGAVAGKPIAEWPQWHGEEHDPQTENASGDWERFATEHDSQQPASDAIPMTLHMACRLLGVEADSTWSQIKKAYWRMAGKWHPDRMQHSSEETRRLANDQMIAINQAYCLLRERRMQQAA